MEGTDWKGYDSGVILCTIEDGVCTLDLSSSSIAYSAKDWVIPYKVKDSEGNVFNVEKIIGSSITRPDLVLIGSLTIPNSVTSIGANAFEQCSGLTGRLNIGSHVISIGNYAFYGCSRLTGSLIIPNSVISIGYYAFYECSGLTGGLTIGSNVNSIGYEAFWLCSGLTGSLTIPNSVESIGGYAFQDCSGFSNITLDGYDEVPIWDVGSDIFYEWNNDSSSTVSTSNGSLSSNDALGYLKGIGLPSNWTAAA